MNFLLSSLGFISGQTIGALIVLLSLKMFRTGFNLKEWGDLILGVVFFCMGAYIILFTSIFAFADDLNEYRLTYVWTYAVSISLIYLFTFREIINELTDLEHIKFLSFNYIMWIIIITPIASICYQFDGIFIGASQTAEMRNGMIISVALYILSSHFLISIFGNHGLWLSLLFFMIIRSIALNYYFNRILKKF